VTIFSCRDDQCSADAHSAQFGLQGGKGGACTNAMMLALQNNPNQTWVQLLKNMRENLRTCGRGMFAQIPQLCSSRPIKMDVRLVHLDSFYTRVAIACARPSLDLRLSSYCDKFPLN
jgi:hypothetical protein